MTRSPHEIAESIVRSKEWADGKFSTDGDLKEWAKLVELIERALAEMAADRDRWRTLTEAMRDFVQHAPECVLSQSSAGEPTPGGGYRTMYAGKWYQTRPVDETPKCECGLGDVMAAFEKAPNGQK